uniref:Uncharacterized protein n=1 Tax=Cyprinus carpio TaxID=7962 RepID=A0A8C1MKY7_CYPCA
MALNSVFFFFVWSPVLFSIRLLCVCTWKCHDFHFHQVYGIELNQIPHLIFCSFLGPDADEACQYVTGIVGKNPLLLRELNLSKHELGDTRVNQITALLQDKHCKLNTLILCRCSITEKQCLNLTSALKSNPSHLRELDLSGNKIENKGVKHVSETLKDVRCKLERLRLRSCDIKADDCSALTSALKSNPSHLRELDLSRNKLGDSGVKHLSDLLKNPQFKLEKLALCKCSIKEKHCLILKSNPSHLRELDLSGNELGESGVENLGVLLSSSQCKLEKLHLCRCSITEKQCLILTSALCLNSSHLRELDLSGNEIENTGVNHLCDVLKDSDCKLERLSLNFCGITDVSSLTQSLSDTKALQFLKELDLSNNKIGYSKQQLIDVLRDSNCKLSLEKEYSLWRAGVNYFSSFGGLLTGSKAQEDPVKSTEQDKSQSDEESSEGETEESRG